MHSKKGALGADSVTPALAAYHSGDDATRSRFKLPLHQGRNRRLPYSAISTGECEGPASGRSSIAIMHKDPQLTMIVAAPKT